MLGRLQGRGMDGKKLEELTKPGASSAHEKRRSPRFNIDVTVKVAIVNSLGITSQYFGRGNDLSEGGMAIFLAQDLAIGSKIRLTLTLPLAERAVTCQAVVRSRNSYRYGVEFAELAPLDREFLSRTCRSLSLMQ